MPMMPRINFRLPPNLLAEAERRAAAEGVSVGEWTRKLIEKETGIHVEVKKGLGGADERTRNRVHRARDKAFKKRAKGQDDAK